MTINIKAKQQAQYKLGSELRYFCNRKYQNQKRASKILGIPANTLSMVINGHRAPSSSFVLKFTNAGFDEEHFKRFFQTEEINPDILSKKEVIELVRQQAKLIEKQAEIIKILMKQK